MGARVFLGLNALVWIPYGIWCFLDPGYLAGVSLALLRRAPAGAAGVGA